MKEDRIKVLDDITHVLTRPQRYIGSTKLSEQDKYILENGKIIKKKVNFIASILTLFREPINNSIDCFIKTEGKFGNKIDVVVNSKTIEITDNGTGITSAIEPVTGLPDSVCAFTQLKSGSNFSDNGSQIGQNGEGVSLCNIMSKRFTATTCDGKKKTTLNCKNNLSYSNHSIKNGKKRFTKVSYDLDFEKLGGISGIDDIHLNLIKKSVIDLSLNFPKIKFTFNGENIKINSFSDYVKLYTEDEFISASFNNIDIAILSGEYDQISFVNGLPTISGGQHVDYIVNQFSANLRTLVAKKYKEIKPIDVKNNIKFIINIKGMKAPRFDSQTKEKLTNTLKEFGNILSDIDFDNIAKKVYKTPNIMFPIIETFKIKEEIKKRKELAGEEKKAKKKTVDKLIEANSKNRRICTLYLAEGESAMGMSLAVRNPDQQAFYPLRGRIKNCQDLSPVELMKTEEISNIVSILGLKLSSPDISNIRYGKIVIMTDEDVDGYAICCGLINLFYTFWPDIVTKNRLFKAQSYLIKAKNISTGRTKEFISEEEFDSVNDQYRIIEFNKGLGSLEEQDYAKMLSNLIQITYDPDARNNLDLIFGADADPRKEWMQK